MNTKWFMAVDARTGIRIVAPAGSVTCASVSVIALILNFGLVGINELENAVALILASGFTIVLI